MKKKTMEQTPKKIYFNAPQRLTQLIGANTTVIVAGRRTGKTDSIASPFVLRNMQRMAGSTGGIVVPTYKHGSLGGDRPSPSASPSSSLPSMSTSFLSTTVPAR